MNNSEKIQKNHYNNLAIDYERHYDDFWSQKYRAWFVYRRLFGGVDLNKKLVLEAMCGSGQATDFLTRRGARVIGLDISEKLVASFKRKYPREKILCESIVKTSLLESSIDAVVVIGGLHHLPPVIFEGIKEIHRILKPSGYLFFYEPHSASIFNILRRFWYKHDKKMFETNESAIDMMLLKKEFINQFTFKSELYGGSLAYLFVYNSLIFRIPLFFKTLYSPILFLLEYLVNPLLGPKSSMFVLGCWQKIDSSINKHV